MGDIGFGIIGQGIGHSRSHMAQTAPGGRLIATCDLLPDRRERAELDFGVPSYEDYHKLLERRDIDVIGIFTPAGNRREIALDAFAAGKHVICTKPMEINIDRCDDMISAADKAGRRLVVDFGMRYAKSLRALKKATEDGMFGRLMMSKAELRWYRNQEYYDWNGGWRGTWRLDGGGSLANQTVHYIDQVQWIMGPPASVCAYVGVFKHKIEAEDQGIAVVRWKNGGIGVISGATTSVPYVEMNLVEILGDRGLFVSSSATGAYEKGEKPGYEGVETWDVVDDDGKAARIQPIDVPDGPKGIMEDVVSMLTKGTAPMVDGREGRKSVEILNGIYASSQTGKEVKFPLRKPFIPKEGYQR